MKSAAINSVFCCTSWRRPEEESQEKTLAVAVSTNSGRDHMCMCREAVCHTDRLHLTFIIQPNSGGGGDAGGAADPSTCVWVSPRWALTEASSRLQLLCGVWNMSSSPTQQVNVDDEPAASLPQWPLIQSLLYTRASCERLLLYCFTTLLPSKSHL